MPSIYNSEAGKNEVLNFYDTLLSDWQQPCEQCLIPTSLGDTFVISCGNKAAEPLILLHGSGSNSAMWKADVKEYFKKYHVICIDIIGECGKSAESRPAWSGNNYSDCLSEIFTQLHIKNASIIACSLGGWIATDFTIKHPKKVNQLVLLATAGVTPVKLSTVFWIVITSLFGSWGFRKLNELVYGDLEIDQTALQFAALIKKHFKPRTDVLSVFSDTQLHQIEVPVLFIGGENDCFYNSQKTAVRLRKNLKRFKNDVLPDTGHVLIKQTGRIAQFLEGRL